MNDYFPNQRATFLFHNRYKAVIDACSLQLDIDLLPFGDQTEIGERVSLGDAPVPLWECVAVLAFC